MRKINTYSLTSKCSESSDSNARWSPTVPRDVDFWQTEMPYLIEDGISKEQFEGFFCDLEVHAYEGFKWEWSEGRVWIYELVGQPHERASRAFEREINSQGAHGGWADSLSYNGSSRLINPNPNESNWEPDCSYLPERRNGPPGDVDGLDPYPTMVLEAATSETTQHVLNKVTSYLSPGTTIQVVIVIEVRRTIEGAGSLQLWKFQRDRSDLHFELGDPNCTMSNDPRFQLALPVHLLYDNAPIPPSLVGVENVVLDLFAWKRHYLRGR